MKKQQEEEEEKSENSLSETLKCPRCDSTNTKFCYYNNYNKSQPRHFCRACKRHWTKGGTLRNVPFGGFRNNNKRLKKPTTTTTTSSTNNIQFSLDQKNMSSSLYQALICPPPLLLQQQNLMMNMRDLESEDFAMTQNQSLLFPFSTSNPLIRSSSNVYNYVDESTIDSVIQSTGGINTHAWEIPATSGDWSWEDIDSLV